MFQVAVCDDEAVFLDRTVQILHDAFGEMPHAIQTFQTAGAALSAIGKDCGNRDSRGNFL